MSNDNRRRGGRRSKGRDENPYIEKLININRVSKVVKGGRNMSFSALTAVGDGQGSVGLGFGKAAEVASAIRKANEDARRNMKDYREVLIHGRTIPHKIIGKCTAAKVLLKPASPGTGVIAGGAVRAILDALGVQDVLTKSMGAANTINIGKATIDGLDNLESIRMVAKRRGIPIERLKR